MMLARRNLLTQAQQALIRAFLPGPPALLRFIGSQEWNSPRFKGERITIEYDLPDPFARSRAFALAARAKPQDVGLPSATISELQAKVRGDVLTVFAAVVFD